MTGNIVRTWEDVKEKLENSGDDIAIGGSLTVGGTLSKVGVGALTPGASVAWNVTDKPQASLLAGEDFTLENPTNMQAGEIYSLVITQDDPGSRVITWGTAYQFAGGTDTVLTTGAADAIDVLLFYCDGTNMFNIVASKAQAD